MRSPAVERFIGLAAEGWEPRPSIGRAEWCEQNLRMPVETSATPGRYDLTRYSYCREPLEAVDDPEVEQIVLVWATQLGKTTLLQAMLASQAELAPVPAMLGTPDKDALVELRDKFYLLCATSPALRGQIPPPRLRNNRWMDVGKLKCQLAYSWSTQRMSGKSCALVLCTELDRWRKTLTHGDPAKIIAQRVKAFFRSTIVYESTPSVEGGRIGRLYAASDRRRFLVPCPRCNRWQELRFFPLARGKEAGRGGVAGLKDADGKWLSADQARESAHYLCVDGCRIASEQKPDMVREGRWVPKGQSINTRTGKLVGSPERSRRIWGGRLNSLYAESVSFGRIAAEYLDSRTSQADLQVFWNDWLALDWRRKAAAPKWKVIGQRLAGQHRRGTIPAAAWFLTAGGDVQENRCYWIVRAWGARCTSWLVDWGVCRKVPNARGQLEYNSDLNQLVPALIDRSWPVMGKTSAGYGDLWAAKIGVDTGYRIHDVHQFLREQANERLYAVAGDQAVTTGFFRLSVLEKNTHTGKPYEGGLAQWQLNVDAYKEDIRGRWDAPQDGPGGWFLPAGIVTEGTDYLRQICNEAPVNKTNAAGQAKRVWTVVTEAIGNHYWDCEVYARAMADFVTEGDWSEKAPAPRQEPETEPGFVRRREARGGGAESEGFVRRRSA